MPIFSRLYRLQLAGSAIMWVMLGIGWAVYEVAYWGWMWVFWWMGV